MNSINPQLPYYLMLFVLTLILRFIRAYRNRPSKDIPPHSEEMKNYNASFWWFGFEIVNVSAGVFILLSEHATKFVGAIMMLYVILVILSFFFEEKGIGRRVKTAGHIGVSLIVILVTFYAFFGVEGIKPSTAQIALPEASIEDPQWKVSIPYIDTSLNRNFGVKTNTIQSVYIADIKSSNRELAVDMAIQNFYSSDGPLPFVEKSEKSRSTMIVLERSIVAEKKL